MTPTTSSAEALRTHADAAVRSSMASTAPAIAADAVARRCGAGCREEYDGRSQSGSGTDAEDGRVGQGIAEKRLHHQSAHGECRPGEQRSPCCGQTAVEDDEPCRFAAAAAKGVYSLRPW